jgi:hypothetical protein
MKPNDPYRPLMCSELEQVPPTTLVPLDPIRGTSGQVESLWSYLHRVADAHAVRLVDLLRHLFLPQLGVTGDCNAVLFDLMHGINRHTWAGRVIPILEKFTRQVDLVRLTLSFGSAVLAAGISSRRQRAWCPECLAGDETVHERLLWSIRDATHCPVHRTRLLELCPKCSSRQRFGFSTHLWRCTECGHDRRIRLNAKPAAGSQLDLWRSDQASSYVAVMDRPIVPSVWRENLEDLVEAAGSKEVLSQSLRVPANLVTYWTLHGGGMRSDALFRWAWITDGNVGQLLTKRVTPPDFRPLPRSWPARLPRGTKAGRRILVRDVLSMVERIGREKRFFAPTVEEITRELGVTTKHKALASPRYRELILRLRRRASIFRKKNRIWGPAVDISQAARIVVRSGMPLTMKAVGAHMKTPATFAGVPARSYFRWVEDHYRRFGELPPCRPPPDILEYWRSHPKP